MITFEGKGVYGALALGKVSIFKRGEEPVRRIRVSDPEAEKKRFVAAKEKAKAQLDAVYEKALKEVGETNAQIFEIHKMMLDDDDFNDAVFGTIESQSVNAEYAVAVTADRHVCRNGRRIHAGPRRRRKGHIGQAYCLP